MVEHVAERLDPLLQNYWMSIHHYAVHRPSVSRCPLRSRSPPWEPARRALGITVTRRWTLFSWFVLGTGVLMGGYWAIWNWLGRLLGVIP